MGTRVSTLKEGDVLYDCRMQRCGNTTMSEMAVWKVQILGVELLPLAERGRQNVAVTYSWNGNRPQRGVYDAAGSIGFRRSPPEWSYRVFGGGRRCHICGAAESEGHRPRCDHPKAIRARANTETPR
jgi:hypothetical protein